MKAVAACALQLACGAALAAHASAPLLVTVTVVRPAPVAVLQAAGSAQQLRTAATTEGSARVAPSPPTSDVALPTGEGVQYLVVEY